MSGKKYKAATSCEFKPWLSKAGKEGRFIQVGNSLLLDEQFKCLSSGAKSLYLSMAMECGGRKQFTFPQTSMKKYGLSPSTAKRGIDELIGAGFITKTFSGKVNRVANQYEFNFKWKM